jgi:hypothetical protein
VVDDGRAQKVKAQQDADRKTYAPTGSFLENTVAGFGKAFVDTGRGIKQLLDIPAAALERTFNPSGSLSRAAGMPTAAESQAATQAAINQAKVDDAPLMSTGGGIVGNVVGQAAQFATGVGAAGAAPKVASTLGALSNTVRAAPVVGRLAVPAAQGAAFASLQPVATEDSRAQAAGLGALGGAAGQVVASGIGRGVNALSNAVSPAVRGLAQRAEAQGIPVYADQLVNSKPLNALSAALDYVPFSGKGATREAQQKAFNTAVSRTVGENTDNVVQAVAQAEKRLGSEFDRVLSTTPVKADNALMADLTRIQADAASLMTDAQAGVIGKQVNNLLSKVNQAGEIDGQAAYNIKKMLDRLGNSNDTTLAASAREMRDSLLAALNRSLGPQDAAKFATTRQQWGNMRELQKLVPAGAEGDLSAARLAQAKGRIRGDDLSELSDIAGQFLKGRVGDSGTAQRAGVLGGLFAGGAIDPMTALTAGGMGLTVGRGSNALLSSAATRNALMNQSPLIQSLPNVAETFLPAAGALTAQQIGR